MLKILITSVGSLVGYNILDVLENRRAGLQIIGTNSLAADSNIFRCDRAYLVPETRLNTNAFQNRLQEILGIENPDLVIPGRDDDLPVLAALRAQSPASAGRFLCGSEAAVDILRDKWRTFAFAHAHQLPFAATAVPDPSNGHKDVYQLAATHRYPLVVKPRCGFGSNGVYLVLSADQLGRALEREGIVVQQVLGSPETLERFQAHLQEKGLPLFYSLEDEKISLQTFVDPKGNLGPVFCTVHGMRSGYSHRIRKIEDDALAEIAQRFAAALSAAGWVGPLNIQGQRSSSGEFFAYELNGRFTGATSARYHLGFDELGDVIERWSGIRLDRPDPLPSGADLVSKYMTTRPIRGADLATLQAAGTWSRFETPNPE